MLLGCDSQILIYLYDSVQGAEQKALQLRCEYLLELADQGKHQLVTAAWSLSEFLVAYPPEKHASLIAAIGKKFLIAPFSQSSISIASQIVAKFKPPVGVANRTEVKRRITQDAAVVASLKSFGASEFYSMDAQCRSMCGVPCAKMVPRELPTHSEYLIRPN